MGGINPKVIASAVGGFIIGAFAVWGVSFGQSAGKDPETARVEEIVREFIMENPQLLLESIDQYITNEERAEADRFQERAVANLSALQSEAAGWAMGAAAEDATVTIVEFFDYHCGYCKRAAGEVIKLVEENPDVRIVFKEYPILSRESQIAARAALAARQQGKYFELHQAFMKAQGRLTEGRIDEIAGEVGLDVAKLRADMESPSVAQELEENLILAQSIGVSGTPAFIVNEQAFTGWSAPRLHEMIHAARSEAG